MANYANLLATIAANIYTNGNNEVTAAMVKTAVDSMVASLGAGYQFMGVATPATNPGTPDYKCFYIANEPGTYTNFGGASITKKSCILFYDTAWGATYLDIPSMSDLQAIYKELFEDWEGVTMDRIQGKLIGGDGSLVDTTSNSFISDKVFVVPGDFLRINASSWYGYAFYAFYDADDNLVSLKLSQPGGTVYYIDDIVQVPSTANYLLVASTHAFIPSVHIEKPRYISISESLTPVSVNSTSGQLIGRIDDPGTIVPTSSRYNLSEEVVVTPGNYYQIRASSEWGYGLYAFYDSNGDFVSGEWAAGDASTTTIDKKVLAPSNAVGLRIANAVTVPATILWDIALNEQIKADSFMPYTGKKWAAMGDSLTEVNTRTAIHYHDYVAEVTGISVVNLGVSGSGYAAGSPFYNRISTIPLDSDVVTIFGSFNDLSAGLPLGDITDSGTTSLCGCINKTLDDLYTAFPLVNLGIITPTPWNSATPTTSSAADYVQALIDICNRRSIPCLDLFHCSNLRPWDATFRSLAYSHDGGNGVHPDETGHKLIAPRFEEFIKSLLLN